MNLQTGADSTRDRIVTAATTEFARHGIAGARIDRIAKAARTSKERVYAYFRSKEDLYRFVSAQELAVVAEATRMDPTDLPGYAGRLHDYFTAHPERHRLMAWGRLELDPNGTPADDDPIRQTIAYKTGQLRKAQDAGHLDPAWDPLDILVFVNQIATSWADQAALADTSSPEQAQHLAARRAAIVTAVERLFPAAA
ncbi:TetR family transcriptional regulator [Streptomyces sp. NPDC057565]|uniref:TetR family transcriptional regulator n=1 Tax=Streptomyces sp. NPDC057565 TaxID=3346169 RepID=UPI003698928C